MSHFAFNTILIYCKPFVGKLILEVACAWRYFSKRMNNSSLVYHINQKDCSPGVPTAFTAILSTISLLAFTGNLAVITTFIKTLNLKTSPNYYIVNMAVSDLLCVAFNWPLYATEGMLQTDGSLIKDLAVASLFCKLGIYSRAISYAVSILSLVLIAVDRFIAIAFPLKSLMLTGKIRKIFLFLSWCLPGLGLVPYFLYPEIVEVKKHTFCRNMMSQLALNIYHFFGFVLFYCVPLFLIVALYSRIMKHLKRKRKIHNGQRSDFRAKRIMQSQNIMKIFGSIVLGFFICWTPLYVYMLLKALHPSVFTNDECLSVKLVGIFYYIFPLLSTAINPFILITFSSSYRAAVKSLCSCLFRKMRPVSAFVPGVITPQGQSQEVLGLNKLQSRLNDSSAKS